MPLEKPIAGPLKIIAASYHRALAEREFIYAAKEGENPRREVFSLWQYLKEAPVLIFPVTPDRKVVAVRQFRHGSNDFAWEVPGGLPKPDQSPSETASRELLEETGYEASDVIDLERSVWMDSAAHNLQFKLCVGLNCIKASEPDLDRTEVLETALVPLGTWFKMIDTGEICDSRIITISHLALPYIHARIEFL